MDEVCYQHVRVRELPPRASVLDTMSAFALIILGFSLLAGLLAATWAAAYRLGFEEGRLTVPLRMIEAVAQHRVACEGESGAGVVADLREHLGMPETEAWRIVEQTSQTPPSRATGLRSA
jgi:hypothetical protein